MARGMNHLVTFEKNLNLSSSVFYNIPASPNVIEIVINYKNLFYYLDQSVTVASQEAYSL